MLLWKLRCKPAVWALLSRAALFCFNCRIWTAVKDAPYGSLLSFWIFQVKSGKELKAFLFNDFLMLTRPRSSITGNLSKKIGFNEQDVTYDIYRKVRRLRIALASVDVPISSQSSRHFGQRRSSGGSLGLNQNLNQKILLLVSLYACVEVQ